MIGYKRTKQECKGEQAAKVSKKLTLDKTRKNTGDAVKMPEKFRRTMTGYSRSFHG